MSRRQPMLAQESGLGTVEPPRVEAPQPIPTQIQAQCLLVHSVDALHRGVVSNTERAVEHRLNGSANGFFGSIHGSRLRY